MPTVRGNYVLIVGCKLHEKWDPDIAKAKALVLGLLMEPSGLENVIVETECLHLIGLFNVFTMQKLPCFLL